MSLFLNLILTLGLQSQATPVEVFAQGCRGSDQLKSISKRTNRMNCNGPGRCRAYGYNPDTGRHEYFEGWHSQCPGSQEQQVTIYNCLNSMGIGYTVDDYGPWSQCRIH